MVIVGLNGKSYNNFRYKRYLIDWDRKVSGPQLEVKNFLKIYWKNDIVLEEARIPGSLLRIDLWNISKDIIVEVSPYSTHSVFNRFFHGSLAGYKERLKNDMEKEEWAIKNNYKFVEIVDSDFPLTVNTFESKFGIIL